MSYKTIANQLEQINLDMAKLIKSAEILPVQDPRAAYYLEEMAVVVVKLSAILVEMHEMLMDVKSQTNPLG